MEILIVTGMSGAGKTAALKCFEDIGYFSIDNMPPSLIVNIVELALEEEQKFARVALVMDIRLGRKLDELFEALDMLEQKGIPYTIVFLDAADDVLVRRFSETRRIHPLRTDDLRVVDTIAAERGLLDPIKEIADVVVDTSDLNIHQLREKIKQVAPKPDDTTVPRVTLVSFGYKYGPPLDADIIMDVRFLPNPYWFEELRELSGRDQEVREYVLSHAETWGFLDSLVELLGLMLPGFQREGRSYLTIGIGCTGGRHRSVVVVNELRAKLEEKGYHISVQQRDIDK